MITAHRSTSMRVLVLAGAASLLGCGSSRPAEPGPGIGGSGGEPAPSGSGGGGAQPRPAARDGAPVNAAADTGTDSASVALDTGAAGTDTGSPERDGDAGSGDAASGPAAGSGCGARPFKLCEDFEAGEGGGLPPGWTKLGSREGTIEVTTDQFHSGSKSLRSESATTSQPRIQKSLASLGPDLAGTHWGRIFFKVASPAPTATGVMHITFAALRAQSESRVVDTVQSRDGRVQFLYNLPDDSCCRGSSYNWRFDDQWHCAEWYVNATTNSFRFFYDSTEITQIGFTGNTRSRLTDFTNIVLGVTFYQRPSRPFVAWMDDLAINDTRVGCGP